MIGTINFFETHIGAWEETVDEPAIRGRLKSTLARLREHRGFRIGQDETVPKIIRQHYYVGRKGDLEFKANLSGRRFSIEFFQNVNIENPNGGQYDFRKFDRMPRTMQLACAVEMSHVLRKLLELGYVLQGRKQGRKQGITSAGLLPVLRHAQGRTDEGDLLAAFNRSWNFDGDWARGGRFDRDESGWPTLESVGSCYPAVDRDGEAIASGDVLFCRHHGRLFRGVVRPAPNDQWAVISNGCSIHVTGRELFRCENPSGELRRVVPRQKERVRAELEKALKANAYKRVEALARVAARAA